MHYKDWHYSQIGGVSHNTSGVNAENFDNAIKLLYEHGYCRGFPLRTGVYADNRVEKAYNYIHCGLRYRMVLTPEKEYMFLIDEQDAIPLGIVRYE